MGNRSLDLKIEDAMLSKLSGQEKKEVKLLFDEIKTEWNFFKKGIKDIVEIEKDSESYKNIMAAFMGGYATAKMNYKKGN